MKPIQLYCMALQDRSDRIRWLLEEMQVPYEDHFLKKSAGDLKTEAYMSLNPMSRTPTIIDGDTVLFESVGICMYLADKYLEKGLAPQLNHPDRAFYNQWMVFSVGSLECVVAKMFALQGKTEVQKQEVLQFVEAQCEILAKPLERTLSKQDYLLKSGFSAADIMMAAVIPGAKDYLMKPGSAIEKYMQRMMARPAAIKVKVFE